MYPIWFLRYSKYFRALMSNGPKWTLSSNLNKKQCNLHRCPSKSNSTGISRVASCCAPISVILPDHGSFDTDIFPRLPRQLKCLCSAPLLAVRSCDSSPSAAFVAPHQLRFPPDTVTKYKKNEITEKCWSVFMVFCADLPLSQWGLSSLLWIIVFSKMTLLDCFEDLIEFWLVTSVCSLCL